MTYIKKQEKCEIEGIQVSVFEELGSYLFTSVIFQRSTHQINLQNFWVMNFDRLNAYKFNQKTVFSFTNLRSFLPFQP